MCLSHQPKTLPYKYGFYGLLQYSGVIHFCHMYILKCTMAPCRYRYCTSCVASCQQKVPLDPFCLRAKRRIQILLSMKNMQLQREKKSKMFFLVSVFEAQITILKSTISQSKFKKLNTCAIQRTKYYRERMMAPNYGRRNHVQG